MSDLNANKAVPAPLTEVLVSLRVDGVHYWSDCDKDEVDFLKSPHRHMFHITAFKKVTHSDRDEEIIMLKRDIKDFLEIEFYDSYIRTHFFKGLSCEHICEILMNKFDLSEISVTEDGENGARMKRIAL